MRVLAEISRERRRQDLLWGQQDHVDGEVGPTVRFNNLTAKIMKEKCQLNVAKDRTNWRDILDEEIAEAYETDNDKDLRTELIQSAAVIIAWVEALDRRDRRESKWSSVERGE